MTRVLFALLICSFPLLAWSHDPQGKLQGIDLALKASPGDPVLLVARAGVLLDLARWEEARWDLLEVVESRPDLVGAHALLARTYSSLGDLNSARVQWQLYLAVRPGDGEAWWRLGRILCEIDPGEAGLRILERAIERLPRRTPGRYLELAEACAQQGHTARGLGWIDAGTRELGTLASLQAGAAHLGRTSTPSIPRGSSNSKALASPACCVNLSLVTSSLFASPPQVPAPFAPSRQAVSLTPSALGSRVATNARVWANPQSASSPGSIPGPRALSLTTRTPQTVQLVGVPTSPVTMIPVGPSYDWIAFGAEWRYLDDGTDQGTLWREPTFNDSSWSSGPAQLGYGDGDEQTVVGYGSNAANKYRTTYFRREFQALSPDHYGSLKLQLLRDDGAVVYLNGVEIVRSNMPVGTVNSQTFASGAIGGVEETQVYEFALDPNLILLGSNLLAVEIHQATSGSSDISFDAALMGEVAVSLVRGPYLQTAHKTGITVCWASSDDTGSTLWLGPSPQALAVVQSTPQAVRNHEVALTGLIPDQTYYYAVGDASGILAGGDNSYSFHTAPDAVNPASMRIWAIGDSGTANGDARAVRDAYLGLQPARATDVWLMLGDNAYNSGTDPEYQAAVFDTYPSLLRNTPPWPTFGNHDAASASSVGESGVYYDVFRLPRQGEAGGLASGTEAYYSFDYGRVHFVCLDSQGSSRALGGAMMNWLQSDLAATTADWTIAYWHHPPYTKGSHDSDSPGNMSDMREVALPILEAAGVDLVLGGHSHVYERSFLLDGHYDVSSTFLQSMVVDGGNGGSDGAYSKPTPGAAAHEGTVYTVAGSSGRTSTAGSLDHPAIFIGLRSLGSVVIDIEDQTLTARFLNSVGVVEDTYVITKG